MRQPHRAVAAALVLLLWLAVLTVAFHGWGSGGFLVATTRTKRTAAPVVAVARKMLLAVTSSSSFDAAASPTTNHPHHHRHHHHHHHRHHPHRHHHDRQSGRWNWQGVPPSTAGGDGEEEVDPRYGVQKRLVPTGPNPLHH